MAAIKKSEIARMDDKQRLTKIAELERAMLEMRGEGHNEKLKPLRRAIARLKTLPKKPEKTEKKASKKS